MPDRHHHFPPGGPPDGFERAHEHGMVLFSVLNTLFWLAALALLAWLVYRWVRPRIRPISIQPVFARLFSPLPDISALEILRRRYATGQIDGLTFDQMFERLQASYRREADYPHGERSFPHDDGGVSYT